MPEIRPSLCLVPKMEIFIGPYSYELLVSNNVIHSVFQRFTIVVNPYSHMENSERRIRFNLRFLRPAQRNTMLTW